MSKFKNWLWDGLETILVALVLALIIRAFFIQVFFIPSGSMEPTLDINDRIVVNKFIYFFREPKREEVVVFRAVAPEGTPKKDLIKRVIGLPGETLEIKDVKIYINHRELRENHPLNEDFSDFGPVVIPSDSYFVMGDNRPASADSRYFGFLPKKNILGPTFLKIWPLIKFGPIP